MKVMAKSDLMRTLLISVALLVFPWLEAVADWPQEVATDKATIVVYQPQPESLTGNVLKGRAAMSLELNEGGDPIFGAFWFEANIDHDADNGIATIYNMKVTKVRWPNSTDANEQRFTAVVEGAVPKSGFEISSERLSASLATAETEKKSLQNIKNDPPVIIFSKELAVLLSYDGDPRYADVDNSDYERVLNTPFAVVRKKGSKQYYLSSGTFWYSANAHLGPWTLTNSPPEDLVKMLAAVESDTEAPDTPPTVIAVDKPTELIVTDGAPAWQSLPGGDLLYAKNTETAWLRELSTSNMYILLSGRWFRAKSQDGPWTFVRSDELPASFAEIPPESDLGGLRASVAGTEEANDAMLDAQIPQTAAIERSKASLSIEYDGTPKFESVTGTKISYAVNTAAQVLLVDGHYYAVDNGVWFMSADAAGPWVVADSIPDEEIQKIPPSSPVYNTTYVHIYESTPEVVYVGYTPGYMWSFPYYGVPIYGTGWYYPPYYGRYYYPRPPTWGLHVGYNPWTGWNYGVSWSNGFLSVGVRWGGGYGGGYHPGHCCGGFYGGGYRRPVVINTGDINIYNRDQNRTRNADRATAQRDIQPARPTANRENNVYADRDGNIARRNNDQWESRQDGQWQQDQIQRDNTRQATQQYDYDRSGLNRANQSRQRGSTRQASRPVSRSRAPRGRR